MAICSKLFQVLEHGTRTRPQTENSMHTALLATLTILGTCRRELPGGWLRGVDLNHRPLGYEPNELPDCSTPHRDHNNRTRGRQTSKSSQLQRVWCTMPQSRIISPPSSRVFSSQTSVSDRPASTTCWHLLGLPGIQRIAFDRPASSRRVRGIM